MPLANGQKIIVTSADGTKRRRLPYAQIAGARARLERYGGMGEFTVNTAIPFSGDALSSILKGDRVEMYYQGVLRYRGWIEERLRVEGEPDTLGFTGYGLSFLLGQQLCFGRYAYAGSGADLADVFAEIVRDATQSRNQTLPAAQGRQGMPLYDALQALKVGTTSTFVDAYNKLFLDVANDLVQQSGNLCLWGGDVDAYRQNRAYIRPIASVTGPPMHVLVVPARRTQTAQAEDQAGDVKNRTLMTGGQPRFPQLLHNGGFDLPTAFQSGDSGLITDGDFEQQSWSLGNGASYKDAGHQEGQPFSGNWMVELDHVGESVDKNGAFASVPVAGHSYVFSVRAKKEVGLQTADGSGTLVLKDAANNYLMTVPLTVAPAGTAWDYFSATFAMPAGAAHWYAHFQCDHIAASGGDQGGLLLDAVSLEDGSVVYQDGYQTSVYGSAQFVATNWVYKDVAFDGLYCFYANVQAQDAYGQDAHLEPLGRARFSVSGKSALRMSIRYRSPLVPTPGLSLPPIEVHLDFYHSDGSACAGPPIGRANAQGVNSTWQYLEVVGTVPGDAASCCATVVFRGNGEVLVDCISVQDAEAALAGDVPLAADGHPGFLPEGALSTFLTAAQSGLGGDFANSEATYGSRVDITSQGAVNTLGGLTTVAAARLRTKALPLTRPNIARIEDATVYWPGDSLSLQGGHGPQLSGGQTLTLAAVELSFGDLFVASLEEGKEAADETLAVKSLILDQLTKNGPGAAAGAGGAAGGYSNPTNFGGGSTGGGPAYRTTLAASSSDPTLHDAFRTGPHVSDQEHTDLSALASNGAQVALGGTVDANSRLSVSPQGTAENGIVVNLLPGTTGTAIVIPSPASGGANGGNTTYALRTSTAGGYTNTASSIAFRTNYGTGSNTSLDGTQDLLIAASNRLHLSAQNGITFDSSLSFPNGFNVYYTAINFYGINNYRLGSDQANTALMQTGSNQDTVFQPYDGTHAVVIQANPGQTRNLLEVNSATGNNGDLFYTDSKGNVKAAGYRVGNSLGYTGQTAAGDTVQGGIVTAAGAALGTAATQPSTAFDAAGAAATAQAASLQKAANLSDVPSAATARTNLGLGSAATLNAPASGNAAAAQVVLGSDTRLVPAVRQATVCLFYGGPLAAGLSNIPYCIPPGVILTLTGMRLRLGSAGTTATTVNVQKSTGGVSAAFTVAGTSQNLSTASATAPGATTDSITTPIVFNAGDLADINIVTPGVGAQNAVLELVCTY